MSLEKGNFRHIVFFKLHNNVSEADKQEALLELRKLGENNPDILELKIEESLDQRKGQIIVENSLFKNELAFQEFRKSPTHAKAAATLSKIADWWVGDYLEE